MNANPASVNRHLIANNEKPLDLQALGKVSAPYRPTYEIHGGYINPAHAYYAQCPTEGIKINIGVTGSLRREDALKLYELAYFSSGDILELGCNHGLSTSILSQANHDSGLKKQIFTNDLEGEYTERTRTMLTARGLAANVHYFAGDAVAYCAGLAAQGKQFSLVFVDHSHAYDPVYGVCRHFPRIVSAGGLVLFHDFNDKRNPSPEHKDYAVAQAVVDAFKGTSFEFYGIFGCTALYYKKGQV